MGTEGQGNYNSEKHTEFVVTSRTDFGRRGGAWFLQSLNAHQFDVNLGQCRENDRFLWKRRKIYLNLTANERHGLSKLAITQHLLALANYPSF